MATFIPTRVCEAFICNFFTEFEQYEFQESILGMITYKGDFVSKK